MRCRERNLVLNPDTVRYDLRKVSFVGCLLTDEGIKLDPKKVAAIIDMPMPTDVEEVRRIISTVQYTDKTVLQELEKAIKIGWQGSSRGKEVRKLYLQFKDELLVEDGIIFKGDRLVVPRMVRAGMVQFVHQGHIGVEGSLRRAHEVIYWPGMNAEVKDHISKCDICNAHRPEQCREELQTHELPHLPLANEAAWTWSLGVC